LGLPGNNVLSALLLVVPLKKDFMPFCSSWAIVVVSSIVFKNVFSVSTIQSTPNFYKSAQDFRIRKC